MEEAEFSNQTFIVRMTEKYLQCEKTRRGDVRNMLGMLLCCGKKVNSRTQYVCKFSNQWSLLLTIELCYSPGDQ